MKPLPRQIAAMTAGVVLLTALGLGALFFLRFLWSTFAVVNPAVGTGIVAAAATIIVSVISVLIAKRLEQRALLLKEHRDKKTPFYEEMVKFVFHMAFAEKLGQPALTEKQIVENMAGFTENLVVWGSEGVILAWFKFRNRSARGESADGAQVLFEIEDILLAIRKDLGHTNKGLTRGKVLGLFVNDIHKYVADS